MRTRVFEIAPEYGYRTLRQMAAAMGISVAQVWRVQHGQRTINGTFISGALRAFPDKVFSDLFYVEDAEQEPVSVA
jgi:16S rRNA U516 pseudouridylate synthase RsuA-like enzyme